jgi:hypothetical protein
VSRWAKKRSGSELSNAHPVSVFMGTFREAEERLGSAVGQPPLRARIQRGASNRRPVQLDDGGVDPSLDLLARQHLVAEVDILRIDRDPSAPVADTTPST